MNPPHIPNAILEVASQRIAAGESWVQVCKSIGCCRSALRLNFIRAGLPVSYPRTSAQRIAHIAESKGQWDEKSGADWLRKPLRVSA